MQERSLILAIDVGALVLSSTVFDQAGHTVLQTSHALEFTSPAHDWQELDANAIWHALEQNLHDLSATIDLSQVQAVGICCQQSTCLIWDRQSGEVLGPVLAWNDRRTAPSIEALRDAGHALLVQVTTGTALHSQASASKLRWLLDHVPGAGGLLAVNQLLGSTLDSWLLWKLTNGQSVGTDYSNAQRTQLFTLDLFTWSPELLRLFSVPPEILPIPQRGVRLWGNVQLKQFPTLTAPISAVATRQAAASSGHGNDQIGTMLCSYDTNIVPTLWCGTRALGAREGLTTLIYNRKGEPQYSLSHTITGGALVLEWCRSRLMGALSFDELLALAASAPGDESVIFVPAFTGVAQSQYLGRAAILGLQLSTDRSTIARAALESIAFQVTDALSEIQHLSKLNIHLFRADGKLARSDLLMQLQADLLGIPVERSRYRNFAALGIAQLAAQGAKLAISEDFLRNGAGTVQRFEPRISQKKREQRLSLWHAGIKRALNWAS
jgi:glycerol kinase